ncbi:DUF4279 domain-containing protein [Lentzea sp. NEAU-D13]|uniref:DUF4279 domain-containing protein n=1 Tax=Lentzea alba TaxID=2714351 RepID=A0A7C9W5E5_9PSEU|nr:DUF4279 domain-containing protein [Lentzea alba]NGY63639.1 DUF4279 domain-containing protein [Lentzea alba]
MDSESWSKATLRVWADGRTAAEIHSALGIGERSSRLWMLDVGPPDVPLDDRLQLVEAVLAEKREVFVELAATCEMDLFVSWTPKDGQDHLLISANLMKLLGEMGAHVKLDTWTGS